MEITGVLKTTLKVYLYYVNYLGYFYFIGCFKSKLTTQQKHK